MDDMAEMYLTKAIYMYFASLDLGCYINMTDILRNTIYHHMLYIPPYKDS